MNQYGRRAQKYWQRNLPGQYAQIQNPETFFDQMGQTLADQIEALAETIAGPDRPGENFMDKLGRLNMAKADAETEVFREALPQPEHTPQTEQEPRLG